MYLVLCYDISSNLRRSRLFRRLKDYLRPVQRSVFEGRIHPNRYAALIHLVQQTVDHEVDTVRIYRLCRGCVGLVDLIGTAAPVPDPDDDLVL